MLKAREGVQPKFNITWYTDGFVSERIEFSKVALAAESYQVCDACLDSTCVELTGLVAEHQTASAEGSMPNRS